MSNGIFPRPQRPRISENTRSLGGTAAVPSHFCHRAGETGADSAAPSSARAATAYAGSGGTLAAGRANFSFQFTRAVAAIRMPSVMIAPTVIVSPLSPSKKKL